MYAIEFETDINNKYIEIKEYEKIANKHVRVIILIDENVNSLKEKKEDIEIKMLSDHSANLIKEWKNDSEDDIWI